MLTSQTIERNQKYAWVSRHLESFTDTELLQLLSNHGDSASGIGGEKQTLVVEGISVFVKKIRLTELEKEDIGNTQNLFNLPLCYQYGVGSTGFGVKRELLCHELSTQWVLEGTCPHFPILYHSRIFPRPQINSKMTPDENENLEKDVKYWEGSTAVRNRLIANHQSPADVYLFLEWFPWHLDEWLNRQVTTGDASASSATAQVLSQLLSSVDFMKSQDFIHFDAHFRNILTDGTSIFLSDFGLGMSKSFHLSDQESEFFQQHVDYDKYFVITNLIYCVLTAIARRKDPDSPWQGFVEGFDLKKSLNSLPFELAEILAPYSAVAKRMNDFLRSLFKDKNTIYPREELEQTWPSS